MSLHSPSDIELVLYCYCSPEEPHPRLHAPAIQRGIELFLAGGIIELTDKKDVYTTTEMGEAWVEMICNTPYPVQTYIDPREEK